MMHMPYQTNVADEARVLEYGLEEAPVVYRRRDPLLHQVVLLGLDRSKDRLRDRLRVLLLHGRLDALAVDLERGGVVLLVLVQHHPPIRITLIHLRVLSALENCTASRVLLLVLLLVLLVLDDGRGAFIVVAVVEVLPNVVPELVVHVHLRVVRHRSGCAAQGPAAPPYTLNKRHADALGLATTEPSERNLWDLRLKLTLSFCT